MEAVQGLRKARFERETWTYFGGLPGFRTPRGTVPCNVGKEQGYRVIRHPFLSLNSTNNSLAQNSTE
ncbi:hypothetical protein EMCRGX_G033017 [Ephydatia muelleri]